MTTAPASTYTNLYNFQKSFFETGKTRSYTFRKEQLLRLRQAVKQYEDGITEALHKDLHKPATETYVTEIGFVYEEIKYVLKHLKSWMKPRKVSTPLVAQPASSKVYHDPLGLTFIIAPWNYPFQLLIAPLVGAIAGGNCAVLKPSEETPHTAQVIEDMVKEFFPEEYLAVVQGNGAEVVPELMDNFRFDHVFFTGSVPVGKIIMAAAAKHLTPVTLELGGKSPCIVDETANLKVAAKRIAWGKFLNAGQTCVAPDYVLVHTSVKEEFTRLVGEAIKSFYGEDAAKSPDYPRMVNEKRYKAVAKFINPEHVVLGGQTDEQDKYIAPTILDRITFDDPVMQEEIFGPVLPILTFEKLTEVPQLVGLHPYPLALYLFTSSKENEKYILNNIRFGAGCINDTVIHLSNPSIPFGGIGTSGFGSYHGKYSFDTFTHAKGILKTTTVVDVPLRYPPYGDKGKYVKMVMK
ncbi:aldehyde dehydrogenase [Pontibacter cellulosilyticus]|uniref:Aldehyde dehydrogenase n=1 Tax=Pontibacter cellulosilyticus TaxID=1720253 RepID=A0A923SIV7_9BACT|nr:aldehyde dehydrogenase [Pontibacter cellulosilyticus]MBC5993234.1 aldehyde dehydrogenase [Pontibacter cellulosilyticus]